MNIGIKSDDVKSQARQITGQGISDFNTLKGFLDNIVKVQIPDLWQGAGAQSYVTRYEELEPSFKAIEQLILDIGTGLEQNATYYEEADAAASSANAGK